MEHPQRLGRPLHVHLLNLPVTFVLDGGAPGCATNCTNVKQWSGWDQGFK